jgi:DNA-binding NarL/FixJ family response regulator
MKKLLVVDDHPTTIMALQMLLRQKYEVTCVLDSINMLKCLQAQFYDLIILDLDLSDGTNGLTFISQLVAKQCRVVVFSGKLDAELIRACYLAGAAAVLDKTAPEAELLQVLEAVNHGVRVTPENMLATFIRKPGDEMPMLPAREMEFANLCLQVPRLNKTEIAARMGVSNSRVTRLSHALRDRLHLHDDADLVAELKRRRYRPTARLPKKK